jgi:hypothetical protein
VPSKTKHHLIVAHEVTKLGNDRDALSMMAHTARDAMAGDAIEAIADNGYCKGEEIVACEQAAIAGTASRPLTSKSAAVGRFDGADLVYQAENREEPSPERRLDDFSDIRPHLAGCGGCGRERRPNAVASPERRARRFGCSSCAYHKPTPR